jgi:hypothetical protein
MARQLFRFMPGPRDENCDCDIRYCNNDSARSEAVPYPKSYKETNSIRDSLETGGWHPASFVVLAETGRWAQGQTAIRIQTLPASPTHRIALPFDFDFRSES